jgi:hypothetical protein
VGDRPWWGIAAQWTLWALIMFVVMGWLAKSRLRARPVSDARRLRHPPSTLIVGGLSFVFWASIAVISNVVPNKTTTWWTTAAFVAGAVLSIPLVVGYFRTDHHVSEDGLAYTKALGTRKYLRWSDVSSVRYAAAMKWFRLETRSGEVARISVMLMGLPQFAGLLLAHAPGRRHRARHGGGSEGDG